MHFGIQVKCDGGHRCGIQLQHQFPRAEEGKFLYGRVRLLISCAGRMMSGLALLAAIMLPDPNYFQAWPSLSRAPPGTGKMAPTRRTTRTRPRCMGWWTCKGRGYRPESERIRLGVRLQTPYVAAPSGGSVQQGLSAAGGFPYFFTLLRGR